LVTNKEFAVFVDAGGYDVERYWQSEIGWKWAQADQEVRTLLVDNARSVATIHLSSELAGQRLVPDEIPERCVQMICRKIPMYWHDPSFNRSNQPIVGINWWEACAYCAWLEETLRGAGTLASDRFIRLPFECEWETAARLCGDGKYPWLEGELSESAYVRAAYENDGHISTLRSCGVALFQCLETRLPIFDLVGNVWEWTASIARPYDARSFSKDLEPQGLNDRIARGSSWLSSENESTEITFRSFDPPYNAYEDLGLRIAIAPFNERNH
jgi:formylglycine-generating enzyme required for sulfatase activity